MRVRSLDIAEECVVDPPLKKSIQLRAEAIEIDIDLTQRLLAF